MRTPPPELGRDDEVDTQIMLLESPFGSQPHLRERERAAQWLTAHADRAYPRLLARLDLGEAGVAAIALLPHFGRAESIPILARLLTGSPETAWDAAQALARHSQPAAAETLRQALTRPEPYAAIAAADALGTRGDLGDCAALSLVLGARDARVRAHAVQAAAKIGCLGRDELERLAGSDGDAEVRALAAELLAGG